MPFLGTTPTQGFVSSFPKQSFTPNGSTTVFTLTNPVASANDLEVFVGNVRQEPTTAYTAAGTTLTMSEAPDTGLNFYVINKSFAQVTTAPTDGSVTSAKLDTNIAIDGTLSAKGGAVFNEDSADVDFRVESNGNINMIHVDGGSDVVTIGGLTGTAGNEDAGYGPLQVGSTSTSSTIMQFLSATNGYNTIHFGDGVSGTGRYAGYIQYDHNHNLLTLGTNSTDRLAMANDGQASYTGNKNSYYMWSVTNSYSGNCGTYRSKTSSSADNTSSYHFVGNSTADRVFIYGNGNIVNTNNSYGSLSDVKLKENIVDSGSQWDDIKAVKVRKFSMKEDKLDAPNKIGVIAQELEASNMGGLVFESPDRDEDGNILETKTKQVHYSVLYMKAIKALQEAMTRIETLETEVAKLKG